MDTSTWWHFFTALVGTPKPLVDFLSSLDWTSLAIAALTPLMLLYSRREIRVRRLRGILEFMKSFKGYGKIECKGGEPDKAKVLYNPSLEFVKSKYTSDIRLTAAEAKAIYLLPTEEEKIEKYIEHATERFGRSNNRIYLSAIGFIIVSYYGFKSLLGAFDCSFTAVSQCGINPNSIKNQMIVIGTLAFAGAFIAAVRMFLRSLAVFDLSAYTLLRHTAEIVFSVILVMLVFRAFPDPFFNVAKLMMPDSVVAQLDRIEAQQRADDKQAPIAAQAEDAADQTKAKPADTTAQSETTPSQPSAADTAAAKSDAVPAGDTDSKPNVQPTQMGSTDDGIPWLWFALAPVFGLLPISSSKFLLLKMQTLISWIKTTDDRFVEVSKVTTLDVIDGIDFETRFRLEECGIYDVQNLATYNPVMLHIETPYGIYQSIDWIAQAQLCHIVGQEKFLMFRELNVRTIFDLERAIDSRFSPGVFDEIYASVLLAPTEHLKKAAAVSSFKFLITNDQGAARQVSVDEFCTWAREKLKAGSVAPIQQNIGAGVQVGQVPNVDSELTIAVEHMMAWISDDLHIRRLRRLWLDIGQSLGEDSNYFSDSKRIAPPEDLRDKPCEACAKRKAAGEGCCKPEAEAVADDAADHIPDTQTAPGQAPDPQLGDIPDKDDVAHQGTDVTEAEAEAADDVSLEEPRTQPDALPDAGEVPSTAPALATQIAGTDNGDIGDAQNEEPPPVKSDS